MTRKYFLLAGDVLLLVIGLALTLLIRYRQAVTMDLWQSHLLPFSFVVAVLLIVFYIENLYAFTIDRGRIDLLNRLIRSMVIGGALAVVFFYLSSDRLFAIKPQRILLIYLITSGFLIYAWRLLFNGLARSPKIGNGLLLVGFNQLSAEISTELMSRPTIGYHLRGIMLTENDQRPDVPAELQPFIIDEGFSRLKEVCIEKKISTIVSTIHPRDNQQLLRSLINCLPLKINFFNITHFYERITGKIPVTTIEEIWFLENLTNNPKRLYDVAKRLLDLTTAALLLLISLPFTPFIISAIWLNSRRPILFTQIRVGRDSKPFLAIKFRTMLVNAEQNGPQWATKNDPRVTTIGRFLRKTRIDEIPQLWNVLMGEMSLIGPRPERPEFVEQLSKRLPFYTERLLVKPGLTGWAQVAGPAYGGSVEESLEKLQYDLFYIKNRSLGLDISIILKTIKTVLSRKGQ